MAEYIEREALRKILIEHFDADFDSDGKLMYSDHICTGEDCDDLLKLVNKIPTADVVKVRHGEWSNTDWSGIAINGYMVCTQCNVMIPKCEYNRYCLSYLSYCPKCGAKMGGKVDSNER